MKLSVHKPDSIFKYLNTKLSSLNRDLLLLLPGGSFSKMYPELFQALLEVKTSLKRVTVSLTDDRYSSNPDHPTSNMHMLEEAYLKSGLVGLGTKLRPILEEKAGLIQTAMTFSNFLKERVEDPHSEILPIIGLGVDGHIAGILPIKREYLPIFQEGYAVGYDSSEVSDTDNPYKKRISISFNTLKNSDEVWLYAVGEEKREVLKTIYRQLVNPQEVDYATLPAYFLHRVNKLRIFTDQL